MRRFETLRLAIGLLDAFPDLGPIKVARFGDLIAENALLRQQLIFLHRQVNKPRFALSKCPWLVLLASRVRQRLRKLTFTDWIGGSNQTPQSGVRGVGE